MPRAVLRNLYAAADAFVLPTRGEGWGLPIAEAMAMAMPVIATNWSGPKPRPPTLPIVHTLGAGQPYYGVLCTRSGPTALLTADNSFSLAPARMLPGGQAEARRRPRAARAPPARPPAHRTRTPLAWHGMAQPVASRHPSRGLCEMAAR